MLTALEMMTGLTIEKGQVLSNEDGIKYQSYRVIKQPNTGARQRLTDYDLITTYLIPAHRQMTFEQIKKMTGAAIERLKKEIQSSEIQSSEIQSEIQSKIQFLHAVTSLIDKFVVDQDIINKTKNLFIELFRQTHPNETYLFTSLAKEIYDNLVDKERMQNFINDHTENCFSGCMTVKTAIEFWCDPRSISGNCDNRQTEVQCTIIRFLMSGKNSSDVERDYAVMKRNFHHNRPNLKLENLYNETFLRELKRQSHIFIDLKSKDQTKKRDQKIRKV